MEKLQTAIREFQAAVRERFAVRLALLGVLILVAVAWFTPVEWANALFNYSGGAIGIFLSVVIGGVIGWLTNSKKQWLKWTCILAGCTALLWVLARTLPNEEIAGSSSPSSRSPSSDVTGDSFPNEPYAPPEKPTP